MRASAPIQQGENRLAWDSNHATDPNKIEFAALQKSSDG
jgi:hypothetical protein